MLRFDEIPLVPSELKVNGMEVYLVSTKTGVVNEVIGLNVIRALPSCRRVDLLTQPGALLTPTTDYYNRIGTVLLINIDNKQLEADYNIIRTLELNNELVRLV